jgi:uncharacterized membrane protein
MKMLIKRLENLSKEENLEIHVNGVFLEDRFELGGVTWLVYLNNEQPSTLKFDKVKRIVEELSDITNDYDLNEYNGIQIGIADAVEETFVDYDMDDEPYGDTTLVDYQIEYIEPKGKNRTVVYKFDTTAKHIHEMVNLIIKPDGIEYNTYDTKIKTSAERVAFVNEVFSTHFVAVDTEETRTNREKFLNEINQSYHTILKERKKWLHKQNVVGSKFHFVYGTYGPRTANQFGFYVESEIIDCDYNRLNKLPDSKAKIPVTHIITNMFGVNAFYAGKRAYEPFFRPMNDLRQNGNELLDTYFLPVLETKPTDTNFLMAIDLEAGEITKVVQKYNEWVYALNKEGKIVAHTKGSKLIGTKEQWKELMNSLIRGITQ